MKSIRNLYDVYMMSIRNLYENFEVVLWFIRCLPRIDILWDGQILKVVRIDHTAEEHTGITARLFGDFIETGVCKGSTGGTIVGATTLGALRFCSCDGKPL